MLKKKQMNAGKDLTEYIIGLKKMDIFLLYFFEPVPLIIQSLNTNIILPETNLKDSDNTCKHKYYAEHALKDNSFTPFKTITKNRTLASQHLKSYQV